jgi:hypothetical protein
VRAARAEARWLVAAAWCLTAACGTDVVHLQSTAAASPARPPCVSIPESGTLCVYCGTNYTQQRACLKCLGIDPTTSCSPCLWSDLVDGGTCQQCVAADGTSSVVGCTGRADLQVPSGTP